MVAATTIAVIIIVVITGVRYHGRRNYTCGIAVRRAIAIPSIAVMAGVREGIIVENCRNRKAKSFLYRSRLHGPAVEIQRLRAS
jgi:hypothetical protein